MDKDKSCYDCKNAVIFEDKSVGIQAYLDDCKMASEPEVQAGFDKDLDEVQMAKDCSFFNPHMIEVCHNCKQPLSQPIYSWKLWVMGAWEELAVCSEKCKVELQDKVDKEIEEMKKSGW